MFERSTADARPDEDEPPAHRCAAGRACRNASVDDGERQAAITAAPNALCDTCTESVRYALDDMTETWVALHMSIGDQTRRRTQKVAGSRSAPVNLNTDVDALKVAIVEWLTAAAARVAETLNVDDPQPRNNTDFEHARIVLACTRIITPHVDRLLALPAEDVNVWLGAGETEHPGEYYVDEHGGHGRGVVSMTGIQLALKVVDLRRTARSLLALTAPHDRLTLPCPGCNELELIRTHRTINLVSGRTKDIDQIDCANCDLSWPYERYQQLCLIWVKEDEMERDKLQKQLDTEKKRRELVEWLLAKREWQLGLALECTDVSASAFAATILASDTPDEETYLSDKDIAIYVDVAPATVRSWATRGHITRHTADDGSTVYLAHEVWNYAKTRHLQEAKATA